MPPFYFNMDNRIKLAVYKSLELHKLQKAKMEVHLTKSIVVRCNTRFVHEGCLENLIVDIEQAIQLTKIRIAVLLFDVLSKYHVNTIPTDWWFTEREILLGYSTFSTDPNKEVTHIMFLRDHKINDLNIKMGEVMECDENSINNLALDILDKRARSLKYSNLYKYLRTWYEKDQPF